MVACCAHHVTDVLPILGLTAAATFLAEYRIAFMLVGLGMTLVGIVVMLSILLRVVPYGQYQQAIQPRGIVKKLFIYLLILLVGIILTACSSIQQPGAVETTEQNSGGVTPSQPGQEAGSPELKRTDTQSAIIGTMIGIPAIGYLLTPAIKSRLLESWISVGSLDSYPIGEPREFNFTRSVVNGWEKTVNSHGVFILREDETKVRVFSDICTHLACRVNWHPDQQHYISPCHDGHFDIVGNVISGPPPRPLDEYVVKVEDGNLLIQFPPFKRA